MPFLCSTMAELHRPCMKRAYKYMLIIDAFVLHLKTRGMVDHFIWTHQLNHSLGLVQQCCILSDTCMLKTRTVCKDTRQEHPCCYSSDSCDSHVPSQVLTGALPSGCRFNAEDNASPLYLTEAAEKSRFFRGLGKKVKKSLQEKPYAMENHSNGQLCILTGAL